MAKSVYFYKGEETFLTNAKIQRLIKESKVDELNINSYDCGEVNVEKAVFDALTPAFLGDRKAVIIRNPVFVESEKGGSEHNLKLLLHYLRNPSEETILIVNASGMKVNERLNIVRALNKSSETVITNGISEVEFAGWLRRECETRKVRISGKAISFFYKNGGGDLELTKNEIDKVIAYVGEYGTITEETVRKLVFKNSRNDIYALTDAICAQNKKNAFLVYRELTRYEKDVTVLINLISRTLKDNILVKYMIREGMDRIAIAAKMRVSPNRAYYMIKNAEMFSDEVIKRYIHDIAVLDFKIKSGRIDRRIGFEEFLLNL